MPPNSPGSDPSFPEDCRDPSSGDAVNGITPQAPDPSTADHNSAESNVGLSSDTTNQVLSPEGLVDSSPPDEGHSPDDYRFVKVFKMDCMRRKCTDCGMYMVIDKDGVDISHPCPKLLAQTEEDERNGSLDIPPEFLQRDLKKIMKMQAEDAAANADAPSKREETGRMCGKCGMTPKKGHNCPYSKRKKRSTSRSKAKATSLSAPTVNGVPKGAEKQQSVKLSVQQSSCASSQQTARRPSPQVGTVATQGVHTQREQMLCRFKATEKHYTVVTQEHHNSDQEDNVPWPATDKKKRARDHQQLFDKPIDSSIESPPIKRARFGHGSPYGDSTIAVDDPVVHETSPTTLFDTNPSNKEQHETQDISVLEMASDINPEEFMEAQAHVHNDLQFVNRNEQG